MSEPQHAKPRDVNIIDSISLNFIPSGIPFKRFRNAYMYVWIYSPNDLYMQVVSSFKNATSAGIFFHRDTIDLAVNIRALFSRITSRTHDSCSDVVAS